MAPARRPARACGPGRSARAAPALVPRMPDAQPARASAASIARRVYTTAIAARYSRPAWMSALTVRPSTACAAAAAIASGRAVGADERRLDRLGPVGVSRHAGDRRRRPCSTDAAGARDHDGRHADHRVARRRLLERRVGRAGAVARGREDDRGEQLVVARWPW